MAASSSRRRRPSDRKDPMGNMHVEFARDLMKHMPEFRRAFKGHKYEFTEDGGILFPAQKAIRSERPHGQHARRICARSYEAHAGIPAGLQGPQVRVHRGWRHPLPGAEGHQIGKTPWATCTSNLRAIL